MKKGVYLFFGLVFMSLGLLGYLLPVMPGTIFMILAAFCFLRSSEKLYKKVVTNPSYGESVRLYVEEGYINKRSKTIILISMWSASLVSITFLHQSTYLCLVVLLMSSAGSALILRARS